MTRIRAFTRKKKQVQPGEENLLFLNDQILFKQILLTGLIKLLNRDEFVLKIIF